MPSSRRMVSTASLDSLSLGVRLAMRIPILGQ
jgi:hypothetical protein